MTLLSWKLPATHIFAVRFGNAYENRVEFGRYIRFKNQKIYFTSSIKRSINKAVILKINNEIWINQTIRKFISLYNFQFSFSLNRNNCRNNHLLSISASFHLLIFFLKCSLSQHAETFLQHADNLKLSLKFLQLSFVVPSVNWCF